MCLIVVAAGVSARYPLVLAANRDELHQRPTEPARWWADCPNVLGGRDAVAGGGWLAIDHRGRVAAVTNLREDTARPSAHSRGWLVSDFLRGTASAEEFAAGLEPRSEEYAAFNLLLIDGGEPRYLSNRAPAARLGAGIHALSNAPLGTSWPKTELARRGMRAALEHADPAGPLLELLATRDTEGGGDPADRLARALFIEGDPYGTRSSTVVLQSADGRITFIERRFDESGAVSGESRFDFRVGGRA